MNAGETLWTGLRRFALEPPSPERVELERRGFLLRNRLGAWIQLVAVVAANLGYATAFHRDVLGVAALVSAAEATGVVTVFLASRSAWMERFYPVPYFLTVGVLGNADVAAMLHLTTGSEAASPFFYGYFLILLSIPSNFPARPGWMLLTAASTPISFAAFRLAHSGTLRGDQVLVDFLLLIVFALVATLANMMTSYLFAHELDSRISAELTTQRLRELDRVKSEFFANVSHDLRSPLTAVLGPLNAVAKDAKATLSGPHRSYIELALRGAARLESMIDDLLELSRIDAGIGRVRRVRADLGKILADQVEAFEPYATSMGLRIAYRPPADPVVMALDADKIARVAMNLISNACKFSPGGGEIRVEVKAHSEGACIVVQDPGIGISPEEHASIFRRFERGVGAREMGIGGSGLGLAVTREFVALHAGRVEVESAPGRGSTFTVILPGGHDGPIVTPPETQLVRSRPPPSLIAPLALFPASALSGTKPRVVLAEGDDELRRYLHLELGEAYDVLPVVDGEEALNAVRLGADLVVADVQLARVDGVELAHRIRIDPATRSTAVLILTASDELETHLEAFAAGADDVVRKPFDLLGLWARIEALLRRSGRTPAAPATPLGKAG